MNELHALCWLPIQEHFGTSFTIDLDGKLIARRGIFQNSSSRIALASGDYVVSTEPSLTILIAESQEIVIGMSVHIQNSIYRILTKFVDEPKGVVVCDLTKTKN